MIFDDMACCDNMHSGIWHAVCMTTICFCTSADLPNLSKLAMASASRDPRLLPVGCTAVVLLCQRFVHALYVSADGVCRVMCQLMVFAG
jgi:hypothetical protein